MPSGSSPRKNAALSGPRDAGIAAPDCRAPSGVRQAPPRLGWARASALRVAEGHQLVSNGSGFLSPCQYRRHRNLDSAALLEPSSALHYVLANSLTRGRTLQREDHLHPRGSALREFEDLLCCRRTVHQRELGHFDLNKAAVTKGGNTRGRFAKAKERWGRG